VAVLAGTRCPVPLTVACSRLSVVEGERKKKKRGRRLSVVEGERKKNEGGLRRLSPPSFFSLLVFRAPQLTESLEQATLTAAREV